jgi:uracil-DNA glycosylase family 4
VTKTDELKALCKTKGLNYVGTRGVPGSTICFIGEAPGADEDQKGVPFVGASGRELDRMLDEAGVDRQQCWWTNPYKVRPPDNKIDHLTEHGIPLELFHDQFFEELNQFKPTFIIPLGATPLTLLCPTLIDKRTQTVPISKYRGSLLRSDLIPWDAYILPAYHPAYIFRAWEERQIDVLCFARLREEYDYFRLHGALQPLPSPKLISDPAADDAIDYLRSVLSSPQDTIVSIDIENIGVYSGKYKVKQRNRIPYVIGFSIDHLFGMSIGLGEYEKNKCIQVWQLIDSILQTKRQCYQNGYTHDIPWLHYIGFSPNVALVEDTLVRHHTLWPELSHKLDFQTFQYTRFAYYKDEGKNWSVKERQKMKAYNCKDVVVTLEVYNAQEKEFNERAS